MMRRVLIALILSVLLLPLSASTAMADSSVMLSESRVDPMDLDNDGEADMLRVIYAVNASAASSAGIQVVAETGRLVLPFWNNLTLAPGDTQFGSIDIQAWEMASYTLHLRVWDHDMEVIVYEELLGTYDLTAALNPPTLDLQFQGRSEVFTGEACSIVRTFSDEVGEHYDEMGVVSLTGVPWQVLNDTAPIDCSGWPAGDYTVSMQYTNGLGFGASTSLDVTILNHPAPAFELIVTGDNQRMGTGCAVEAVIDENSTSMLTYTWTVTDPRGQQTESSNINDIDCGLWVPGVHKIRVIATNAQMQATEMGVNLVRLPPIDSNDPTLGNITDDGTWPDASSGDDYEPVPLFMNVEASAGAIAGGGVLIGILLGVFVGLVMRRSPRDSMSSLEEGILAPPPEIDSADEPTDELPTYTDPQGITWRQHPDGRMDWWDGTQAAWVPFEG